MSSRPNFNAYMRFAADWKYNSCTREGHRSAVRAVGLRERGKYKLLKTFPVEMYRLSSATSWQISKLLAQVVSDKIIIIIIIGSLIK